MWLFTPVPISKRNNAEFGGGFPNEKDVVNNPVHGGDTSLGGGTTAQQYPRAEQWAGRVPGPGGGRACHRGLSGWQQPELRDHRQNWHHLQAEYSSER